MTTIARNGREAVSTAATLRGRSVSLGDEYLGAIAAGQIKYRAWEAGDIAVRLYSFAAVIRYRARLEVVFNGHPVPPGDYWHTDAYEHRDGVWTVVWSQATAISRQI
ncbi:nuclear transport factor 2 family protein [Rhizobium mongolense]|uniref:nuclear transport factor 2 family protein n=1 Tax=Rhizobium TaxID=379 RepID=UPI001FEF517F|nr:MULTISPECIES: nuclear transport factor 2 family protein [unclassified Rhizobium]WFU91144.1 nuclear transport factor 2 family protein [Rhizobium sp. CC1099]